MAVTTNLPRAAEREELKPGDIVLARFQRRGIVGLVLAFNHGTWLLVLDDPAEDVVTPRLEHIDNTAGPYRPLRGNLVFEGPEGQPWGEVHPGRDWPGGTLRVCADGELLIAVDAEGDFDWFSITKGEYAAADVKKPFADYLNWRLFEHQDGAVTRRLVTADFGL